MSVAPYGATALSDGTGFTVPHLGTFHVGDSIVTGGGGVRYPDLRHLPETYRVCVPAGTDVSDTELVKPTFTP